MSDQPQPNDVQASYNRVSAEYARRFWDETDHKPFDRQMLDRLAEMVKGQGLVCDMGCGPGQIARYLRTQDLDVCGVDLSPEMVAQARRLNPAIEFKQGNMLALIDVPDSAWAGIAAFYCIIHIPRPQVVQALTELKRVLIPGGVLLLTFHVGSDILHLDEWWDEKVSLDFVYFQQTEMEGYLHAAGFEIEDCIERAPYENIEYQSHRVYIFARKPC